MNYKVFYINSILLVNEMTEFWSTKNRKRIELSYVIYKYININYYISGIDDDDFLRSP